MSPRGNLLVLCLEALQASGDLEAGLDGQLERRSPGSGAPWPCGASGGGGIGDDAALFVAGDRAAFARIVRGMAPRVRALLVRLVGSREDAEDLAQEVFVRAWDRRTQFDGRGALEGWLLRIAVHAARDHGRRRRPTVELDDERERARGSGPSGAAHERELSSALRRAITGLPTRAREAFVLRVLEERSYDETAAILGLVPGTVRILVMKARRRLERELAPFLERGGA